MPNSPLRIELLTLFTGLLSCFLYILLMKKIEFQ